MKALLIFCEFKKTIEWKYMHSAAYLPVAATTVAVPALGVVIAIILFSFGLGI